MKMIPRIELFPVTRILVGPSQTVRGSDTTVFAEATGYVNSAGDFFCSDRLGDFRKEKD